MPVTSGWSLTIPWRRWLGCERKVCGAASWLMVCLCLHATLSLHSSWNSSACSDEPDYAGAGRYILETNDWKFSSALFHPPLTFYWNSLPLLLTPLPAELWSPARHAQGWTWYDQDVGNTLLRSLGDPLVVLRLVRLPFLLLSLLLLTLLYTWSDMLWGPRAAAVTGLVYALSPALIANSGLATTDLALALFLTGHAFCFWLLDRSPSWKLLVAAAVIAGGCLGSKLNGLFALPLGLLWIAWFLKGRWRPRKILAAAIMYATVPWLVLWGLYGFTVGPAQEPGQRGEIVSAVLAPLPAPLADAASAVLQAPVPLPQYLRLAGNTVAYNRRGAPAFLLGEFRQTGWWYYFPVALMVKTPIPILLLALTGSLVMAGGAGRRVLSRIIIPQVAIILVPAMNASLNIGVRHVLAIEPLFALCSGAALAVMVGKNSLEVWRGRLVGVLAAWLAFGTMVAHPYHLAYFNELAGGMVGGEKWLSDSNVTFSLDYARLAAWQREQGVDTVSLAGLGAYDPADYGVRYIPYTEQSSGWIAVDVMLWQFGASKPSDPFERLRRTAPAGRVGSSLLLFRVEGS